MRKNFSLVRFREKDGIRGQRATRARVIKNSRRFRGEKICRFYYTRDDAFEELRTAITSCKYRKRGKKTWVKLFYYVAWW